MKKIINRFLFAVCCSFIISFLNAQHLPSTVVSQIDSLFKEFNTPNTPGCAVGVVRNDSLIYAKGYGLANLEYDIPITPKTVFYLCSVGKQFTAYSIVLLAKARKINLEDDIHNHLPWVPDLKKKITIRHLLNHTSGLRDDLEMASFGGLGDGRMVSQELAIQYIKNSRGLNYEPGEKYLYSNSNYVLLAEIVKEKSGQSFKAFTDSALFKPLGMESSFFLDEPYQLIKNRAASYYKTANQFDNALHNVFTLGDGGMFSNIEDLSKWVMNFYNPKIGNAEDVIHFTQNGVLNNGSKIPYALGIIANQYKGFKQFTHGGALAGYRTNIAVFPELKMAFIILSNNGSVNPADKSNQLADIFLKNYTTSLQSNTVQKTLVKYYPIDSQFIKLVSGNYISDDGVQSKFQYTGQNLLWESGTNSSHLVQTGKEIFEDSLAQVKFKFSMSAKDTTAQQFLFTGYNRVLTKYIPDSTFISDAPAIYTGTYFSPELESRVEIIFKDGGFLIKSPKYGERRLKILDRYNMLFGNSNRHLKFFTDGRKQVTAFELNSSRMMHVRFNKLKK